MYRYLWIVYTSAKDLEPVKLSDKMEVYAYVSISGGGGPKTKQKTTVDRDGGTNPTWNDPMNFMATVGVSSAYPPPYAAASATTSGYPPPSPGTGRYHAYPQVPVLGYGYPPPPLGYGYPSPQPGYGYPMLQQPAENNKLGGLGRWLGRVFVGAAISDMLTHASDGGGDGDGDAGF